MQDAENDSRRFNLKYLRLAVNYKLWLAILSSERPSCTAQHHKLTSVAVAAASHGGGGAPVSGAPSATSHVSARKRAKPARVAWGRERA